MEYIQRKVFLTRNLVAFDSDGDGKMDSLLLSATTKNITVPLNSSYDDMGILDIGNVNVVDVIDMGSFWNDGVGSGDITKPTTTTSVTPIVWGDGPTSGGSIIINEQEVRYCGDVSAQNHSILSATTNGNVLIDSNGSVSQPFPSPSPTFIIDNSLCVYQTQDYGSGDVPIGGSNSLSPLQKLLSCDCPYWYDDNGGCGTHSQCSCSWTTLPWAGYRNTAYTNAIAYCQSIPGHNYTRVLVPNDFIDGNGNQIPQGDCNTEGQYAFASVKVDQIWTDKCCASLDDNGDCNFIRKYRFRYCFYCAT